MSESKSSNPTTGQEQVKVRSEQPIKKASHLMTSFDDAAGRSGDFVDLFFTLDGPNADFPLLQKLLAKVGNELGWLSIITAGLMIPVYVYRIIYNSIHKRAEKAHFAVQVLADAIGITIGIGAFVSIFVLTAIFTPALILAGAVKSTIEWSWKLGKSLRDWDENADKFKDIERDRGTDKEEKDKLDAAIKEKKENWVAFLSNKADHVQKATTVINEQRAIEKKIAVSSHYFLESLVALGGAALLFTPLAPLGITILICDGLYMFADICGLNPLKRIAQAVNFFSKKFIGKPIYDFSEVDAKQVWDAWDSTKKIKHAIRVESQEKKDKKETENPSASQNIEKTNDGYLNFMKKERENAYSQFMLWKDQNSKNNLTPANMTQDSKKLNP